MNVLRAQLARLRAGYRATTKWVRRWMLGTVLGAIVLGVLVAKLSGLDPGQMIGSNSEPPALAVQRRSVIFTAADNGLDLVQERDVKLKPGGGNSWFVQFSSPPNRSDEMRIYDYVHGELVLRYRFVPRIVLRPESPGHPVSIRLEPIEDYDRDGRPDLVGSFGGPRNGSNFPARPFVVRYVADQNAYDTFPLRGAHTELVAKKTYRLPNGRLVRAGSPISDSDFARRVLIREGHGKPGRFYEGVFEFIVGYSERLHAAVALVAYAPRFDQDRRFRRWETDVFGLDWSGTEPRSAKCILPIKRWEIDGRSLFLTDVQRRLRDRLSQVSLPCR